ncbi:Glycoside hydrolase [Elaphomyces granulatus]
MRVAPWFLLLSFVACSGTGDATAHPAWVRESLRLKNNRQSTDTNSQRAAAVKQAFQTAWDGYQDHAFPHDQLHPLTNSSDDSLGGWGATAIDALSTAVVMGNADVVKKIVSLIPAINFTSSSPGTISLFETTIRYLGGLLAGYDLLKGPAASLAASPDAVETILAQAQSLADSLKYAFNTPTGIPYNYLDLNSKSHDNAQWNGLATVGTLVLEWSHLSDLTGNAEYGTISQKAESYLLNPQPAWTQPFPGLVGTNVAIETGLFQDNYVGWVAGDDSFYEYLIKMYVYDPNRFAPYKDRWVAAAESTMSHLASSPTSRPDLTFLDVYNNGTYNLESQHLGCFAGGNFLLGGSVLGRQDLIDFGLKLVDGCHETYVKTATGIGPESFGWNNATVPASQLAFYQDAGFYIINPEYILRPEVLESIYYAYRITGDQKYRDWSWAAFTAINQTTRAGSGFSGISNVNIPGGGSFDNVQQSFLLAEVFKYSYLIQTDGEEWQVSGSGHNQFVFNTEAHPLRVAG